MVSHPDPRDELSTRHDNSEESAMLLSLRKAATLHTVDSERRAAAAEVGGEAVALALEAVAAGAAEAALVTAAAATEAAARAADAAETAKGKRAFAADAAAKSVAAVAARTATHVQVRAEEGATQVHRAAALAADELAHSMEAGTALETEDKANLLGATVLAAADATAEEEVEREVAATADAQRELVVAAAADVELETGARAAGVATAARDAATALDTDEHGTATREARASGRAHETEEILAAADERDSRAEIRDRAAAERDRAAGLRSYLGDQQYEEYEAHAGGLPGQRAAALDRLDAKTDRDSSASDRAKLSARPDPGSRASGLSAGVRMSDVAAELSHDVRAAELGHGKRGDGRGTS